MCDVYLPGSSFENAIARCKSTLRILNLAIVRRPLNFTTLVLAGIVIDLATKAAVFSNLQDGEVFPLIKGILEIVRAENRGVAFSMLRDYPSLILVISLGALSAIIYLYVRIWRTAHPVMIAALGLLLIGAIGNLIDRLKYQYVRDFIQFVPPIPIVGHWAVFNFADMCITVGVILFLISELFLKPSPEPVKTEKHENVPA